MNLNTITEVRRVIGDENFDWREGDGWLAGGIRGYGLGQSIFAVESAMDELARALGLDPFELRRRNAVRPGDLPFTPDRIYRRIFECHADR